MKPPPHLLRLTESLRKLPGIGQKSAERFAFEMLSWEPHHLEEMGHLIATVKKNIVFCNTCGALMEESCSFCEDPNRDPSLLCVVASAKEIFLIEETHTFKGLYHVLGTLLSPLKGKGPEDLAIDRLQTRLQGVNELILALEPTLEGDATALYLKKELANNPLRITRLALGIPMGSSLDYLDPGTLSLALDNRLTY